MSFDLFQVVYEGWLTVIILVCFLRLRQEAKKGRKELEKELAEARQIIDNKTTIINAYARKDADAKREQMMEALSSEYIRR